MLAKRIKKLTDMFSPQESAKDIDEMCKAFEIEVSEFNESMELLEDKMNLMIKLLGKDE
jgi:hypothetical protein